MHQLPKNYNDYYLSSIWMSGYGVASDASGDLFFSTGNSNGVVAHNFQDSVVRLSSDLTTVKDYFTPSNVMALDLADNDLSGGGVMVVPDQPGIPPRVVAAGKGGTLYVMNRTLGMMGGYVPGGPDVPLEITIGKCHCGPSYFVGSDGVGRIVTSGGNNGPTGKSLLRTYKNTAPNFPTKPTKPKAPCADVRAGQQLFHERVFERNPCADVRAGQQLFHERFFERNPGRLRHHLGRRAADIDDHAERDLVRLQRSGAKRNVPAPLLRGWVAGTWPNVNANANIVPVVANGRVYVASYQALTIFGLLGQLAPVKQAAPLTMTANPMITERAGPQLFGTITSLSGNRIAVRLRDGASVSVDLTDAFRRYESVVPFVGENVEVHGASAPDGSFMARSMWRTKEPATWGPDRLK